LLDGIGVQLGRGVDDAADKVVLEQATIGIIVVDADEENFHLVHLGCCTHTLYLVHHCR